MTPTGDETKREMRAIAREEAEKQQADDAARAERITKERHSTQIGWAMLGVAALIVCASIASDLQGRRPITFTIPVVTVAVLLAFGGGALVQGVRLDKILTAWKKGDPT
jgi:hypothetical protein